MNTYTIHDELIDATLCEPFATVSNKRLALQIAKRCAVPSIINDRAAVVVFCGDHAIAVLPVAKAESRP